MSKPSLKAPLFSLCCHPFLIFMLVWFLCSFSVANRKNTSPSNSIVAVTAVRELLHIPKAVISKDSLRSTGERSLNELCRPVRFKPSNALTPTPVWIDAMDYKKWKCLTLQSQIYENWIRPRRLLILGGKVWGVRLKLPRFPNDSVWSKNYLLISTVSNNLQVLSSSKLFRLERIKKSFKIAKPTTKARPGFKKMIN